MSPTRTAIQILKAWYSSRPEDERFPVDCRVIANEFGVKVQGGDLGGEFEGGLFIDGGLKAIIYNENIKEEGRKNFTVGHELGHFFLHRDKIELRCSLDDLTESNSKPHPSNIEQEANCFSANLLMPTDDLRHQLKGQEVTLGLAGRLTARYQTTLTAVSLRIVEVTQTGCPYRIKRWKSALVVQKRCYGAMWFMAHKRTSFTEQRPRLWP